MSQIQLHLLVSETLNSEKNQKIYEESWNVENFWPIKVLQNSFRKLQLTKSSHKVFEVKVFINETWMTTLKAVDTIGNDSK